MLVLERTQLSAKLGTPQKRVHSLCSDLSHNPFLILIQKIVRWLNLPAQADDAIALLNSKMVIAETLTQYPYRWDSKSTQSFAELFTEDAVMERWRQGRFDRGVATAVGKAAIFEYAQKAHTGRLADRQTRHHFSNLVFLELSDRNAVTQNMALITHQTAEDAVARVSSSGIYRINWGKICWRMDDCKARSLRR